MKVASAALAAILLFQWATAVSANPFDAQGQTLPAIDYRKKEVVASDLFPTSNITVSMPPSIPLNGLKLAGLPPNALNDLGFNYFVVVTTDYPDMAHLYRENRLRGKGNLVTVDSILHPYIAFRNRIVADSLEGRISSDLSLLLRSMLEVSLADLRDCEDMDVRSDLEHNIAYIVVAMRLLDPQYQTIVTPAISQLVETDLKNIALGKKARSVILERNHNFADFNPLGWYASSPKLTGFFQAFTWLTVMSMPLSDVTVDEGGSATNQFRQSVLLFRSLDLAKYNGQPAFTLWSKINSALIAIGIVAPVETDQILSPVEYKSVFATLPADLNVTLKGLAEPFFRTKLMLTIRNRQPMNLSTTSIFDLGGNRNTGFSGAVFQLLPPFNQPEMRWLRSIVRYYPSEPTQAHAIWPLGLFILHARAAAQADNILANYAWKLDPIINKLLPELDQMTGRRELMSGQPTDNRLWRLLADYFQPLPDGTQAALRTEQWLTRKLEGALAAWLTSNTAIAPKSAVKPAAPAAAVPAPAAGTDAASPTQSTRAFDNYLEPSAETYRRIVEDAQQLLASLNQFGYFPEKQRIRLTDFARLADRLRKISEYEVRGTPLPFGDMQLLSNFDMVLEQVAQPAPTVLPVAHTESKGQPVGINFCLGRPAQVYMIFQQSQKIRLLRGGVYTYYEEPGAPFSVSAWTSRLNTASIKPPVWAESYDVVMSAKK